MKPLHKMNQHLYWRGKAGRHRKWNSGWSRLLNKQKIRNYYKNWGSNEGTSVPITAPGYTSTPAEEVVEEPTEETPLTPKQQEVRNRVQGRPFRSYQYSYEGKTYHTTNQQLSEVYNQGIPTQRQPVHLGDTHRFGSIPEETELPYYPYTLNNQTHLNPALQMTHLRTKQKMLDKPGTLVRPNYKWLKRLGLKSQDLTYFNSLKRQRNKNRQQTATQPTVTGVVEDSRDYEKARTGLGSTATSRPTTNDIIFYTPQVRRHGEY